MSGVRRLVLSGVALTALLALVAVASRAHKAGGGTGAGSAHVPRIVFEYLASVMIVLLPVGGLFIMLALAQSRRQKVLAGERNWRRSLGMLLVMTPIFVAAFFIVRHFALTPNPSAQQTAPARTGPTTISKRPDRTPQRAEPAHFQWVPVVVLASLVLGAAGAVAAGTYLRRKHGDAWDEEAALLATLDEVLADTLEDLRAERDPRRAVIKTYARMERTFAAYGVPRQESEAPLEYVGRVLDRLQVSVYSVRKMTQLFARAKFSPHQIDAGMKDDAIDALAGLKAELEHKEEAAA